MWMRNSKFQNNLKAKKKKFVLKKKKKKTHTSTRVTLNGQITLYQE